MVDLDRQIRRNLMLFVPGKMAAVLGSSIYGFAVGLYILAETGSSLNFAITILMSTLPRLFLGPIAGALADRWDRKKIIIFTDFACAAWLAIVLLLYVNVTQSLWLLYAATAVLTSLNTFYSTAVTSTIYNMVGPDHLQKALSLNQAAASLSSILGPVLGGALFGILSIHYFMGITIITFILSGMISTMINYNLFSKKQESLPASSLLEDFKEGFKYVSNQPFIRQLIIIAVWLNFWFAIFPIALPNSILISRTMEPYQLGIVEGAFSIGMMAMAIVLSIRKEIRKKEMAIIGGMLGLSLSLVLLGLPNSPLAAGMANGLAFPYFIAIAFTISSLIMIINMPIMLLIQKITPDEFRGRVLSLLETGCSAMVPLGTILFGVLLDRFPVWILLSICGASIFLLTSYQIWNRTFIRHIRQAEQPQMPVSETLGI